MRCPNCRSEIGVQPVCPYCGVRTSVPSQQQNRAQPIKSGYREKTTLPVQVSGIQSTLTRINRRLNRLEQNGKIRTVLLAGIFGLQILTMLILLLK